MACLRGRNTLCLCLCLGIASLSINPVLLALHHAIVSLLIHVLCPSQQHRQQDGHRRVSSEASPRSFFLPTTRPLHTKSNSHGRPRTRPGHDTASVSSPLRGCGCGVCLVGCFLCEPATSTITFRCLSCSSDRRHTFPSLPFHRTFYQSPTGEKTVPPRLLPEWMLS